MDPNNLPGPLKVAILVHSVGNPLAQQVLGRMTQEEREMVSTHMAQIGEVPPELIETVAREFTEMAAMIQAQHQVESGHGGDKGKGDGSEKDEESSGLKTLKSLDAEQLMELIKDEHPQTIALILVHISSDIASDVISRLDDETKVDVSYRIANLDRVIGGMIDEIDKVFEEFLKTKETSVAQKTDGVDRIAEILNQADELSGELILGEIEERNPELAARIQQKMFVFEDLMLVDDRGLQKVLRKVETKELSIALKGASEEVRGKIFKNMSSRASEMLKEEIDSIGAVRMKEVEDAQHAITKVIQDLERKGELIISGRRGDDFIS